MGKREVLHKSITAAIEVGDYEVAAIGLRDLAILSSAPIKVQAPAKGYATAAGCDYSAISQMCAERLKNPTGRIGVGGWTFGVSGRLHDCILAALTRLGITFDADLRRAPSIMPGSSSGSFGPEVAQAMEHRPLNDRCRLCKAALPDTDPCPGFRFDPDDLDYPDMMDRAMEDGCINVLARDGDG